MSRNSNRVVRIKEFGGPEVMQLVQEDISSPAAGEIQVKHTAIGFNFIDTYHRTGLYPLQLPATLGAEAVGVVSAVGTGVEGFTAGDRVAIMGGAPGAYADYRNVNAAFAAKLPDDLDDRTVAASMLKGLTAWALLFGTYKVQKGETILVHAAAGGVGLILCQWAKHLGAQVIGTASTDAKCALAAAHGCDHVINYSTDDFVARVADITNGAKLPVVFDSVGKDTFMGSLDCLRPFGMMVSFGNASGPVTGVDLGILAAKGSLYVTRMTLGTTLAIPGKMQEGLLALHDVIASGAVKVEINHTYRLADIQQVHRDAEARKTSGSIVIEP